MSAVELMISRFLAVWGEPPSLHRGMYLAEIRRSLSIYPDAVLIKTADIAIDTRVAWPRPAELRAIALKAAAMVSRRVPEMQPVKSRTPEERARVEQIMAEFRRAMMDKDAPCPSPSPRPPTTPETSSVIGCNVVKLRRLVT